MLELKQYKCKHVGEGLWDHFLLAKARCHRRVEDDHSPALPSSSPQEWEPILEPTEGK